MDNLKPGLISRTKQSWILASYLVWISMLPSRGQNLLLTKNSWLSMRNSLKISVKMDDHDTIEFTFNQTFFLIERM